MKIGFLTFGCDSGKSGIGRYAIEMLKEFANPRENIEFEVVGFADEKNTFLQDSNLKWINVPDNHKSPLRNLIWHQLNLHRLASKRKWDAIFLPAGNRRLPLLAPCPTIGVVHDFSAMHVANKYDKARMFYIRHVLPFLMKRLSSIITISESSKQDIVQFAQIPDQHIKIIFHGVDHSRYKPGNPEKALALLANKFPVKAPYILYISRIEHPGKNHINLLKAFEILKEETDLPHQIILAGSDWDRSQEVHEFAKNSKFSKDIIFTGFVAGSDLAPLLNAADLFVFPSLFEGFGMPILEAMACGIPVACSNVSSMPEVAGDSAELFAPNDPESIKEAMKKVLLSQERHAELKNLGLNRAAAFTWENSADSTISFIKETVEGR